MNKKHVTLIASLVLALCLSVSSCGGGGGKIKPTTTPQTTETTVSSDTQADGNDAVSSDASSDASSGTTAAEVKISDAVDEDAESITGIAIKSAAELAKIGKSDKYPLDGDYVLVSDIDMTSVSNFTPIGGAESESGIVSGDNVFSGTFDGRGHVILGLSINVNSTKRVHVGMFASVGSDDENDPAVIKNIVFKNAHVEGKAKGTATYAVLCGQASGNVVIDNISMISGSVEVENDTGDILGIASLIGQCRTDTGTGCSNNTIHVSNIFTAVTVSGDNNGNSNYTSGLIGRIRGSDLGTLKNVLQLGTVDHEGGSANGNAITSGDSGVKNLSNVYYLAGCGQPKNDIGQAKSYESLCSGKIEFDPDIWHLEDGMYPIPSDAYDSPMFSVLDFVTVTLAEGENADKVESDFTLTTSVMGKAVSWSSSDNNVITIDGEIAKVTKPEYGYSDVTLSARSEGVIKSFDIRVFSGVYGDIEIGDGILTAVNYPSGVTYKWTAKNASSGKTVTTSSSKNPTFEITSKEENCLITLSVDGYDSVTYYNSSIPTIYITSDADYYGISKSGYTNAEMNICTTSKFADTAYDGEIQIKLRGNSTAYANKRPFKIKLDKKTDLFGMGANKHWCLLANAYDRTNLRNKISYDFSGTLGLNYCESTMVNLIFNGEYYGMYEFTEAIRIGETRVDIFDWEGEAENIADAIAEKESLTKEEKNALEDKLTKNLSWITSGVFEDYNISDYYDISGYDITGGYLIEDDAYYDEVSKFKTTNDMKLMLKSPEYLSTNNEMMNYLKNYVQNLEDAIYAPNRLSSEGLHYSEYMDVDSFIDFWVVNTVYKNVELLFKSCYMYKPVGGKITWGPVWDMDWTSANHVNLDETSSDYASWRQGQSQDREYWYKALYNDPWFIVQLYERWNEIGDELDGMLEAYDELAEEIKVPAETDNNRWGYDWTYEDEVSTLREWLVNRIDWITSQMESPEKLLDSLDYYKVSSKISIDAYHDKDGCYEFTVLVSDETVKKCDVLLNGNVVISDLELTVGETKFTIEKSQFREETDAYNSVEILGKGSDGSYLAIKKRSGQNGSNANESACVFIKSK